MAAHLFETITAAQALAVTSADTIAVGSGSATTITVIFNPVGTIDVTFGARTVAFGVPGEPAMTV